MVEPARTHGKRSLFGSFKKAETNKPVETDIPLVSFPQLFRFSTRFELFANGIGLIASAAAGSAQPLMTLLFGNLINEFVKFQAIINDINNGDPNAIERLPAVAASFRSQAASNALYLVFIGIGILICTFIYMYTWAYTAEASAKRIREHYLQAVLRQDIPYFDDVGAGEVATRIQTDTHLVQQGISEKVALVVNYLSSFATGFIIGYARSWRLALSESLKA